MNFVVPDFYPAAAAEIFVGVMILVTMIAFTFVRSAARELSYILTQATLFGAAAITLLTMDGQSTVTFGGMMIDDLMSDVLKLLIYFSMSIGLVYGRHYLGDRKIDRPEFFLLAQLTTLGMMVMVSANHLLPMYMGLEMMSLSLYAMVAFDRNSVRSTEAAMKYFVLGALASGMLLYGMSMVYGATGSMDFMSIYQSLAQQQANKPVLLFGLVFLLAGIAFKLGAAPFHMWVPDVYHGAPTAVTLLIASAPKLAAFGMAMRILVFGLFELADQWQGMLLFLAMASIVIGNIAAIAQTNIKRMLAYSGISHIGFMLLGLMSGVAQTAGPLHLNAYSSAMFYVVAYVLMSLASFGMIILLARAGFEAEEIEDFKGLAKRNGWFALMMLIVMFSMAGIPFFVGFFAKFAVLQAAVAAGHIWVVVIAVIMSVIGAYYYLRVVWYMYFEEPTDESPIEPSTDVRVLLSANGLAIAFLGLLPQGIMQLCAYALALSLWR